MYVTYAPAPSSPAQPWSPVEPLESRIFSPVPIKCLRVQEREEWGQGTFLFAFLSCTDSCFSKMRACKLTKVGKDLVVWANPHSLGILP